MANNESEDSDGGVGVGADAEESPSEITSTATAFRPPPHQTKKQRFDKRKKLKRPPNNIPDSFLAPPTTKYEPDMQFKRKQSIPIANRASSEMLAPILIGSDDTSGSPSTERPNKNGFTPIHVPTNGLRKTENSMHGARLAPPSKVLIKRVNYNYHPIIDFFLRDRAAKTAKAKENGIGHTIVS